MILDAHCDAPSQMLRLRDFGIDNPWAQVDFPKMKRGGVDASFFALYVPASLHGADATSYARKLLSEVKRQVAANQSCVAFAASKEDVQKNKDNGLISILLGIENASALGEDLNLLEYFYSEGVRYVTLTHSQDNAVGDSCTGNGHWGGLSPFGRELVKEMNDIGMLIDLAHSADSTIGDVLSLSYRPVVYTHGCCRALCSHRRNLSDVLIKGIAESGGVVGMSIYPCFLSDDFNKCLEESGLLENDDVEKAFIEDPSDKEKAMAWRKVQEDLASLPRPGVDVVVSHIRHAVEVAGPDHVGIGTDYDGIEVTAMGLEDVSSLHSVFDEMKRQGFSQSMTEKVSGLNFLRLL